MLVLTRKKEESIVVGKGQVKVTVLEIRGDRVRLGIEANGGLPVWRHEIWAEMEKAREGSVHPAPGDEPLGAGAAGEN